MIGIGVNYAEEFTVTPFGVPNGQCYQWISRTWKAEDESFPMHTEIGMLRAKDLNVELMLTHPFGLVEVEHGSFVENQLSLQSSGIARTTTCLNPKVTHVRRQLSFLDDTLSYQLFLTLVDREEFLHLEASLSKLN